MESRSWRFSGHDGTVEKRWNSSRKHRRGEWTVCDVGTLRSGHVSSLSDDPNHSTDRQHQQNNVYYLQSLLLSLLQRNQVPLHAAVEEDSAQLILIPTQCVEHTAWDESRWYVSCVRILVLGVSLLNTYTTGIYPCSTTMCSADDVGSPSLSLSSWSWLSIL
mmetsp:Transcript_53482/g.60552  ORF Transcript_53482/g.60552 Transcript_53482/m.60552 type:complete len:162 (+) Transcript_53482:141-626(+)